MKRMIAYFIIGSLLMGCTQESANPQNPLVPQPKISKITPKNQVLRS